MGAAISSLFHEGFMLLAGGAGAMAGLSWGAIAGISAVKPVSVGHVITGVDW